MDSIFGVISGPPTQNGRNDDDSADRLSYRYTTVLLVFFSFIVSTKSYVGEAISCWCPAHFTDSHVDYSNNYCWVKSTYYLDLDEYIPYEHEPEKRYMISYYQWVPMILLIQALLFYLPCMIWRSLNCRSGIDVNEIVEEAEKLQVFERRAEQDDVLKGIVEQSSRFFLGNRDYNNLLNDDGPDGIKKPILSYFGTRSGHFLFMFYMSCKCLYFLNIVVQLFAMDRMLGSDFYAYGFNVIGDLMGTGSWRRSERFPRVTMCDLKVRRLGNLQRYTLQCVLGINLFNEMLFLIIWWWMFFVMLYTLYTLVRWMLYYFNSKYDYQYITKYLSYRNRVPEDDELDKFINEDVRKDGVFVMRLIAINTDSLTITDVVHALWDKFIGPPEESKPDHTPEPSIAGSSSSS